MARMNRPKNRHISPRAWSWRSSSSSSYRPCRMPRKTFRMPASTTRLSAAIRYRNVAASEVPMTPPRVSYPDFGSTMAPKTARAAMASPAPATMMMQECPRAKKNPVPSGRRPSAVGLRVVLSIAEMWSASKACRAPRVDAVSATPRPSPRPLNWKWCGAIAKAKMPQPPRFRVRTTRAMALSRPRSLPVSLPRFACGWTVWGATGASCGREGQAAPGAPGGPPFLRGLVTSARSQATGLIPCGRGLTVAGQRRAFTGLRWAERRPGQVPGAPANV